MLKAHMKDKPYFQHAHLLRLPVPAGVLHKSKRLGGSGGRERLKGLVAGTHDALQEDQLTLRHLHAVPVA